MSNNIAPREGFVSVGFVCEICEGKKPENKHSSSYNETAMYICDECKKAIKQLIVKQQNGLI